MLPLQTGCLSTLIPITLGQNHIAKDLSTWFINPYGNRRKIETYFMYFQIVMTNLQSGVGCQ